MPKQRQQDKSATKSQSCAKCGACSTVCPVYRQSGREYHTGRGKIHLLSLLDPATASRAYAEILSHCLLCGACSEICSRGIPVAAQLAAARARLTRRAGRHALLRSLGGKLLGQPRLLKLLAPLARRLKEHRLPTDSGLNLRLGLDPSTAQKNRPCPGEVTAGGAVALGEQSLPFHAPHQNITDQVELGAYLFSGCYATHIEPAIGQAVLSLLKKSGIDDTQIAAGGGCCGLAAYGNGQVDEARRLARRNIAAHAGDSPIVVACASCANHLSQYPELLADDQKWQLKAKHFAARVREFSDLLHAQITSSAPPAPLNNEKLRISAGNQRQPTKRPPDEQQPDICLLDKQPTDQQLMLRPPPIACRDQASLKVCYHDPCHLRFGKLRVHQQPRQLLGRIPQLELTELPDGPQCCGHGGFFHLTHPGSATAILEQLVVDFRKTGAQVVTTTCSGCLLHWQQAQVEDQHQARVIHLAILLDFLLEFR